MRQGIASEVVNRNWMSPERLLGGISILLLFSLFHIIAIILVGALRTPVDVYAFGMTMFEVNTPLVLIILG
jgi:hypothetical protein